MKKWYGQRGVSCDPDPSISWYGWRLVIHGFRKGASIGVADSKSTMSSSVPPDRNECSVGSNKPFGNIRLWFWAVAITVVWISRSRNSSVDGMLFSPRMPSRS